MEEDNPPEEEFNPDPEVLPLDSVNQRLYLKRFADEWDNFMETFLGMRGILEETRELIDRILKDIKAGGNLLEENNFLKDKIAIIEENKLTIERFHEMAKRYFDLAVREPHQIAPSTVERLNRRITKMENAIFEIRTLQEHMSKII